MGPQIEVIAGATSSRLALETDRTTVGRSTENDVPLEDDPRASRLHAVFEKLAAGWCIVDLGSSNGTWVNGDRIWSSRVLRHGDEVRIGQTRILFHDPLSTGGSETESEAGAPPLTAREQDVLLALCRPLLSRDVFTEPASTRAIAEELVITEPAVKQHLGNLYAKFGVSAGEGNRRAKLANEAMKRGSVSLIELRGTADE